MMNADAAGAAMMRAVVIGLVREDRVEVDRRVSAEVNRALSVWEPESGLRSRRRPVITSDPC